LRRSQHNYVRAMPALKFQQNLRQNRQKRYLDKARYALVVTLEAPEAGIDLQAEVAVTARAMISARAAAAVDVEV